jgi:hypothetical protein
MFSLKGNLEMYSGESERESIRSEKPGQQSHQTSGNLRLPDGNVPLN